MSYISLCILSYNRLESLKHTLNSLWVNTVSSYELLINDDGSTPEIRQYLINLLNSGKISYLILNGGHNQGVGKSINNLFNIATGKYLIKMDQDMDYKYGWDKQVISIMDTFPQIGCLGLFKYMVDPVDYRKMFLNSLSQNGCEVDIVQDFVSSVFITRPELYKKIGINSYSNAFAEDIMYKKALQKQGFLLALPKHDLGKNLGFGPGPSTIVALKKGKVTVTKIHKLPRIFNDH